MNMKSINTILFSTFLVSFAFLSSSSMAILPTGESHLQETSSAYNSNLSRKKNHTVASADGTSLFSSATADFSMKVRDVQTKLPGIWWASAKNKYVIDVDWALVKGMSFWERIVAALKFFTQGGVVSLIKAIYALNFRSVPVTIYDARAIEAKEGLSKAEFFEKYGFVILESKTAMTAENWEDSNRLDQLDTAKEYVNREKDGGAAHNKRLDDFRNADTPAKNIYAEEVKQMIQTIVPGTKQVMPPAKGTIRKVSSFNGPAKFSSNLPTKAIFSGAPAKFVHTDYGVDFDEVTARDPFFDFAKQRAIYEETEANEFMLVNFWRPIKPMSGPLRSLPLCFLDASTLSENDIVSIDLKQFLGVKTALKYNPKQEFYYYPDMTVNEVVVFKQFHNVRNDTQARMPVFHAAFSDPAADENTEIRVSFEYRVSILVA